MLRPRTSTRSACSGGTHGASLAACAVQPRRPRRPQAPARRGSFRPAGPRRRTPPRRRRPGGPRHDDVAKRVVGPRARQQRRRGLAKAAARRDGQHVVLVGQVGRRDRHGVDRVGWVSPASANSRSCSGRSIGVMHPPGDGRSAARWSAPWPAPSRPSARTPPGSDSPARRSTGTSRSAGCRPESRRGTDARGSPARSAAPRAQSWSVKRSLTWLSRRTRRPSPPQLPASGRTRFLRYDGPLYNRPALRARGAISAQDVTCFRSICSHDRFMKLWRVSGDRVDATAAVIRRGEQFTAAVHYRYADGRSRSWSWRTRQGTYLNGPRDRALHQQHRPRLPRRSPASTCGSTSRRTPAARSRW